MHPSITTPITTKLMGIAIGSRMGPNYACLCVGYMEDCILSAWWGLNPQLYKQYVVDIVVAALCYEEELLSILVWSLLTLLFKTQLPFLVIAHSFSGSTIGTKKTPTPTTTFTTLLLILSSAKMAFQVPSSVPLPSLLRGQWLLKRIPLVLICHPLILGIKYILLRRAKPETFVIFTT